MLLLRIFLAAPMTVQGRSMEPTLRAGDVVLVGRLSGAPEVHRGDLVVFRDPDRALSLKRVIGLAGDRVAIRDGVLEVDGRPLREDYVSTGASDGVFFGPITVAAGTVFVLGDNRDDSIDSRSYGAVEVEHLVGPVLAGLWPPRTVG
ncbi:signal peptidase I [soil metagenome]